MPLSSSPLPTGTTPSPGVASPSPAPVLPDSPDRGALWRSGLLLLLALILGLSYAFNPPLTYQPQSGVVMNLPVFMGDYFGKQGEISKVELDVLPKDTEFARRNYSDSHGHQINCSIVLSGAEQRSIHRPEGCLTGQGWSITDQRNIPIPMTSGHTLVARRLSLERRATDKSGEPITLRAFYVYWFVGNHVTTPSHFTRIFLGDWDRVIHGRAHRWAYVSVFSLITDNLRADGLGPDQTQSLLTDFAKQIVPTFEIDEMPRQAKD